MAGDGIGIVAGTGILPRLVAEDCARAGRSYLVISFETAPLDWSDGHPVFRATLEKPGRLFSALRAAGCGRVVFAGGMRRPELNPLRFDLTMLRLAPRVLKGLRGGDDHTLRLIADVFAAEGFEVRAAQDVVPGLVAPAGALGRHRPGEADRADIARAAAIVAALGPADVGQGAVVAGGLCLGLETVQGTDVMLDFVAATGAAHRRSPARGVLLKAPKPGQDRRFDLPAIGPRTVEGARRAGLAGIAVEAGGVLVLGREEAVAAADAAGLFLWGREAGA